MAELLTDLYYNSKTGFTSRDKLYRRAKELDNNITLKIDKEFLDIYIVGMLLLRS